MEKSIARTILANTAVQLLFIILVSLWSEIGLSELFSFCSMSIIFHFALYFFLLRFKSDFYNQSTGKQLKKINTANKVTLLRVSSIPTIAFLLYYREIDRIQILLPVLLVLIFLTDTFDGQIARRRKQITTMGSMLDSISDYSLLALISIVYFISGIVPKWFFYLIFARLFFQAAGMFLFILLKKPIQTTSTIGGKITIATTMVLYVIELFRLFLPLEFAPAFIVFEYLCGAIILVFSFEKAVIFYRRWKQSVDLPGDAKV